MGKTGQVIFNKSHELRYIILANISLPSTVGYFMRFDQYLILFCDDNKAGTVYTFRGMFCMAEAVIISPSALQWRHNERDGVLNHQSRHSLFNRLVRRRSRKNIKTSRYWPLCGEFTGDRWIPCTNGQKHGKCFHLMTSSCDDKTLPDTHNQYDTRLTEFGRAYAAIILGIDSANGSRLYIVTSELIVNNNTRAYEYTGTGIFNIGHDYIDTFFISYDTRRVLLSLWEFYNLCYIRVYEC